MDVWSGNSWQRGVTEEIKALLLEACGLVQQAAFCFGNALAPSTSCVRGNEGRRKAACLPPTQRQGCSFGRSALSAPKTDDPTNKHHHQQLSRHITSWAHHHTSGSKCKHFESRLKSSLLVSSCWCHNAKTQNPGGRLWLTVPNPLEKPPRPLPTAYWPPRRRSTRWRVLSFWML